MKFFLTTAIDFVNSRPHLGTAYEKITADIIARYRRLAGFETHFLMGNDEHSQNVFRKARRAGQGSARLLRRDGAGLPRRVEAARPVVRRLHPHDRSQAALSGGPEDGAGLSGQRRHLRGRLRRLVLRRLRSVQAGEGSGRRPVSDPQDQAEWISEKNWFFRLSNTSSRCCEHYAGHPSFIEPEIRRNEILRLVEGGLEDISMSRAGQSWGIPVPFDPASVVYVWFDALINYAAAVGYGWDDELFQKWWPADLHIVGKDITRFHCVIWPAMLMSARRAAAGAGVRPRLGDFKGERMSKTLGNMVDPLEAADRFGPDPLRLYLAKEIPYGGDGDFTWERFEEKYNADLANNLGNLVSRVAAMTERYRQGRVTRDRRRLALCGARRVGGGVSLGDGRVHALHEARRRHSGWSSAANNSSSPRRSRGRWPRIRRKPIN